MSTTTTAGGGQNLIVSAVAIPIMLALLADRGTLHNHPALINLSQYGAGKMGGGSKSFSFPVVGLDGYDLLSATSEGSAVSATDITDAQKTVTVARYAQTRLATDWIHSIDPSGVVNPVRLAQSGFMDAMATLTNAIAGLASGFATSVGTSGVAFDHDTFMAAKGALIEAKVPGPYMAVLHPTSFASWQTDLESRQGITQWKPANEQMQQLRGPGFQGNYDGVDIFTCDKIPASGSDRVNMMFGRGAIGFATQEIDGFGINPNDVLLQVESVLIEQSRNATAGSGNVTTHFYFGVVEIEDLRGVQMIALG